MRPSKASVWTVWGWLPCQATQSGMVDVQGEQIPALRGNRLSDGAPLTVYPGKFLRLAR